MSLAVTVRWVAVALAAPLALHAEIIDRIAVSVGSRVITESALDREIRVTAFQNRVAPDFSPANKRATAGRMVEQMLIRQELDTSRYPAPTEADIEPAYQAFKKTNFQSDQQFQQALADAGITEQDLKDEMLWQSTLLQFIEVRFRPGVQVSDEEIQDYFDRIVKPEAAKAHPNEPVALEDYRDDIEEKLAGQRVDEQMDNWLKEAKKRTEIVYHDEAFQ
ncbi:MAG TPA: hypothetical protein VG675_15710 [Bryobacteraceae bacterium]|nr:hypothetical protein [Bryobacteraceae bacterium]